MLDENEKDPTGIGQEMPNIPEEISTALAELGLSGHIESIDEPEQNEPEEGVMHGPLTKEEADDVARNSKPKKEVNNWKTRLYPKIGSENEKIAVMIGHGTTIGSGFMAGDFCSFGKKSVIGSGCRISTRIPKKVSVGDNCTISKGSVIGTETPNLGNEEKFQLAIGENVYIGDSAVIKQQTTTGNNVFIGERTSVGVNPKKKDKFKPTLIGNHCVIEQESTIENGVSISDDCHIEENVLVRSGATIGEGCHLCVGAVVPTNATIGKGYILKAGLNLEDYDNINIKDNLSEERIIIDEKWLSAHRIYKTYKKPVYYS